MQSWTSLKLLCAFVLLLAVGVLPAAAAFYPGSVQIQQVILNGGAITVTKMELGTLNNTPYLIAGETNMLTLKADWVDDSPKTIDFTPSRNFRDFIFEPIQPEPGGPPFIFKNVPLAVAQAGIRVNFRAEMRHPVDEVNNTQSHLLVWPTVALSGEHSSHAILETPVCTQWSEARCESENQRVEASAAAPAAPAATFPAWRLQQGVDYTSELTPAICREWVDLAQSADQFYAWRVPVADQIIPAQSYTLPLSSGVPYTPTLILVSRPPPDFLYWKLPLEVRAEATLWANQHLPAAVGEVWVALGARADEVVSCPDFSPRTGYTVATDVTFDLHMRPQAGENAVVPSVRCHRSARTPDGYTCAGRGALQLVDALTSNWFYEPYIAAATLRPGDPITLHYWVENAQDTAQTFSMSAASTLDGAAWTVYPGLPADPWQPDLANPLNNQLTVPPKGTTHLHIHSTVPEGTALGSYEFALTLASSAATPTAWRGSTDLTVTSDGELPPPLPPEPAVSLVGSASPTTVEAGGQLTYTLTIENVGATVLTGLVLTSTLPDNTTYLACAGADACEYAGGAVAWRLAALGAGSVRHMELAVTVDAAAPPGAVIANTEQRVSAAEGVAASAGPITVRVAGPSLYLPVLRR